MAVLITASHLWILFSIFLLKFTSADTTIVTAEAAQNVTLPCRTPNNNIRVLQWSRDGLKAEDIFVYRNKMVDPDNQHQSFKNRVDLQDRQMKDGDASLILSNVTIHDNGTYKCRVFMEETRLWKVKEEETQRMEERPAHLLD
ncbi:V-set domain containing T-cell activation inhibitor 1-like [Neolamprologus brichardi]|uniref:V-set domain containing T-cell activation inhibitor 1-like n=1 Tax=Neolamprologus brichardi TaxID=32507 RepID=UPI0016438A04|nr:V-set domain containing T-cell activation inhibitor 1-like [Neolamprologus brichardi]